MLTWTAAHFAPVFWSLMILVAGGGGAATLHAISAPGPARHAARPRRSRLAAEARAALAWHWPAAGHGLGAEDTATLALMRDLAASRPPEIACEDRGAGAHGVTAGLAAEVGDGLAAAERGETADLEYAGPHEARWEHLTGNQYAEETGSFAAVCGVTS